MAQILGTEFDDTLYGAAEDDVVTGRAGNDVVEAGAGNDVVDGGDGNDNLSGDAGDDTLIGGAGNDILSGGDGVDSYDGGDGDDRFVGVEIGESVSGGAGHDEVNLLAWANQSYDFTITAAMSVEKVTSLYGVGMLTLDASSLTTGIVLGGGVENDRLYGGSGNDRLFGGSGNDVVEAGAGADLLDGGDGDDNLSGDAGDDILKGGRGNDILSGGDGVDSYDGGDGNDRFVGVEIGESVSGGAGHDEVNLLAWANQSYDFTITAAMGVEKVTSLYGVGTLTLDATALTTAIVLGGGIENDRLLGGSGADRLYGGDGDDVLEGNSGDDLLDGGRGNDVLSGGWGNDALKGGAGNDLFHFDAVSDGNDVVADFTRGSDMLAVTGISDENGEVTFEALIAQFTQSNADAVLSHNGNTLTLKNINVADLTAADFGLGEAEAAEAQGGQVDLVGVQSDMFGSTVHFA